MITTFNAEYVKREETFLINKQLKGLNFKLILDLLYFFRLLHNLKDCSRLTCGPDVYGQRMFDTIFDKISGFRHINRRHPWITTLMQNFQKCLGFSKVEQTL
ncbi:MAG: hypothetical protein RL728_939 [Bacteroidota bacterium]|jgi:hypothetical protein